MLVPLSLPGLAERAVQLLLAAALVPAQRELRVEVAAPGAPQPEVVLARRGPQREVPAAELRPTELQQAAAVLAWLSA